MFPGLPDDDTKDSRLTAERLNEFRQNIDNQNNFVFEERRSDLNRSKNVFIGAVSGIVLAGIVGWFVLSPRYTQDLNVEVPVIRRPQTAIKVQPSNPGGMEILNQDKSIYDIIDKNAAGNTPAVEKLLPPPETPQVPVITADVAPEIEVPSQTDKKAAEVEVKTSTVKAAIEPKEKAPESVVISQAEKIIQTQETKKEESKPLAAKPAQKEIIDLPSVNDAKPQTTVAQKIAAGQWTVQLISSPNQKAVQSSWNTMSKKYKALQGQPHEIESADLGAKGVYYRLYSGSFAERSGADALCNQIKSAGGSCIVKKK